jgi:hypothetical protein
LLALRSRGNNDPADLDALADFVETGAGAVVEVGIANNDAAIVLKSGIAEFAKPAARKLNGDESAAGVAGIFAAAPNCGGFTGTVVLAGQISTSPAKVVLSWIEFQGENDVAN